MGYNPQATMLQDILSNISNRIKQRSAPAGKGRYERKFVVRNLDYQQIKSIIRHHPAMFREIYKQRQINNIYLDTFDLKTYFDNVYGNTTRGKVRIRWYGETFGQIEKPVLELKIKNGLAGRKKSFPLGPFCLDTAFDRDTLKHSIEHAGLPQWVTEKLKPYAPSLLNSYKRQYFLSADRNIRMTIDDEMTYYYIAARNNFFNRKKIDHESVIVEMKYSLDAADIASSITQHLPMRMTKSSKYVNGIETFYPQLAT